MQTGGPLALCTHEPWHLSQARHVCYAAHCPKAKTKWQQKELSLAATAPANGATATAGCPGTARKQSFLASSPMHSPVIALYLVSVLLQVEVEVPQQPQEGGREGAQLVCIIYNRG